jgi:alkylation response protein AidB-like acyl-CoA dehydrogenase
MSTASLDHRTHPGALTSTIEAVRGLSPQIMERAGEMERNAVLDHDLVLALNDAGVFRLMMPVPVGGLNADPASIVDVLSELSYADGSAAWVSMATMTATGLVAAYAGEAAIEAIFASPKEMSYVCAGTTQPRGKSFRVTDGYRVAGRFAFGSGSAHAHWLMGGFVLQSEDGPEKRADGTPLTYTGVVARDASELCGNWDVMGLRATASFDYAVPEQVLGDDFLFDLEAATPSPESVFGRVGARTMGALGHAAFPIGVAKRALAEVAALARRKKQITGGLLVDRRTFQLEFVKAFAAVRAAEEYVRETFTALYELPAEDPTRDNLRAECRLAASHMVDVAGQATHTAYLLGGTDALRGDSQIQHSMRDMHAATQHALTAEPTFIDAASVLLGVPKALIKP